MESNPRTHELLKIADACVVCGLCVPQCPTYRKTGSEADSPRGRIQLMRAVLREELQPTPRFHEHIDACLTCRTCEAVCPNHVRYGDLIDGVRARFPAAQRQAKWYDRPLAFSTEHPRLWSLLRILIAPLQRLGLHTLFRRIGLPELPFIGLSKTVYPAKGKQVGQVALFVGCVSRLADMPVLRASIRLLQAAGFRVVVPRRQGCCGALAQHQGQAETAKRQSEINRSAFAGFDKIVFTASGCGATLLDADRLGDEPFPAQDILTLLNDLPADALTFKPSTAKVWLHAPCSQRNVVKSVSATERLLKRIPGLELHFLPGNDQCCGAAGRYHLDQPRMAEALRIDKTESIALAKADIVLTSNVGCAIWLRPTAEKTRFLHPIELLAQQLEDR